MYRQVGAFGKILSQQAVGILILTSLPRTLRIAEVDVDVRGDRGRFGARLEIEVEGEIPQSGRYVVIANHQSSVDIPAPDATRILDAVSVLRDMETAEEPPKLGRRVLVYGGGNTAVDVAGTAKRLGAGPVIVYRRTRAQMPAHEFEIEEALTESWQSIERLSLSGGCCPTPTGAFAARRRWPPSCFSCSSAPSRFTICARPTYSSPCGWPTS